MFNWSHILTAALLLNVWRCQLYLLNNLNNYSNIYFYGSQSFFISANQVPVRTTLDQSAPGIWSFVLRGANRTIWMTLNGREMSAKKRERERRGGGREQSWGETKGKRDENKWLASACTSTTVKTLVWARRRIFSCHCVVCAAQSQT